MSELIQVLPAALEAVGSLLQAEAAPTAVVVVGGATLNLLGLVARTTQDVDVIARAVVERSGSPAVLVPPDPLPDPLNRAIARVARDFGLPRDWMNTVVARQWSQGCRRGSAKTWSGGSMARSRSVSPGGARWSR